MVRTLIYLPEEDFKEIELIARQKKEPKAKVIRAYITKGLKEEKKHLNAGLALLRLAKLGFTSGDPDFSKNIDKYLYEDP